MSTSSNRLIFEKSPYLLQHAHNPVNWFPWGEEAFETAKRLDKPIFLSIGYSTCHWCHVMAHESFESPEIAALMNEAFVNVKVDREELPEVDGIYMEFAQVLMGSSGGWPLNVVLTPDRKPFFAVTYLPPENRRGLIGMHAFIDHIRALWQSEEREALIAQGDKIVSVFQETPRFSKSEIPTSSEMETAAEALYSLMDPVYGGLTGHPKFPVGYQSLFFLNMAKLYGDSRPLFCVEISLEGMRKGGINDHLGGGFSRYAVDEKWEIPHFEKMLYDNALIAEAYLSLWKYKKKPQARATALQTLDYILSNLQHAEGGFYSAEDADSSAGEGVFYTWTPEEIHACLPGADAELFCSYYGVTSEGNFNGRNVLHIVESAPETQMNLEESRLLLLKQRQLRPPPSKDDKIITSYNGLAIDVLAKAGASFERMDYTEAALKAAAFIKTHLYKEKKLLRRYRDGEAKFNAGLEDYAYLIRALLSLFELGEGREWLKWAIDLCETVKNEFQTEEGCFYTSIADPALHLRRTEFFDGAEPSGNAVHCENLLRLNQLTQQEEYLRAAEEILKAAREVIEKYPPGACYHLLALMRYLNLNKCVVVVALDKQMTLKNGILKFLNQYYLPHLSIYWKTEDDSSFVDKNPIDGQTAVYICTQDHCMPPLLELTAILKSLEGRL